jgi:hypothetical protein
MGHRRVPREAAVDAWSCRLWAGRCHAGDRDREPAEDGHQFILCANALGIWCLELEARGKGTAQEIDKELRANLLPGVTIVPAMVIAIDKAQEAGLKYNRQ